MHIAKTGGETANVVLPMVLDAAKCDVPGYDNWPALVHGTKAFTNRCHFLSYETKYQVFEDLLRNCSISPESVRFLTFLRNPHAHWLSAWEHMYRARMRKELGDASSKIPATFEELVSQVEAGPSVYYYLRNFQMNFFGSNVSDALVRLHRFFWFGLTSEYQLSLALLRQAFGQVRNNFERHAHAHVNEALDFEFVMTTRLWKRLVQLNVLENRFFLIAVAEFWNRVRLHKDCIRNAGFHVPL